jgi:hypothetical protein
MIIFLHNQILIMNIIFFKYYLPQPKRNVKRILVNVNVKFNKFLIIPIFKYKHLKKQINNKQTKIWFSGRQIYDIKKNESPDIYWKSVLN